MFDASFFGCRKSGEPDCSTSAVAFDLDSSDDVVSRPKHVADGILCMLASVGVSCMSGKHTEHQ